MYKYKNWVSLIKTRYNEWILFGGTYVNIVYLLVGKGCLKKQKPFCNEKDRFG